MVGENQLDLGVAEPGETGIVRRRQIEIVGIVDDIGRGFHRVARVDTDLCVGAGHREQDSDDDLLAGLSNGASGQTLHGSEGQNGRTALKQLSAIQ
jgi:hypothetical protein